MEIDVRSRERDIMSDCEVLVEEQPSGLLNGLVKSGKRCHKRTYAGDQVEI